MPRAIWNGAVLAESNRCEIVEGNRYFPPGAIRPEYFKPSETHTACGWKGTGSHYDLEVAGEVNRAAAWYSQAGGEKYQKLHRFLARR